MAKNGPATFPRFEREVKQLVQNHLKLEDEPLLLAIYYKPQREMHDIFLFEVIQNFGDGEVDPDRELFEVTYASTTGLPLEKGQYLHLVMTNPKELEVATQENWVMVAELRAAMSAGDCRVLHKDAQYVTPWEPVHA